MTQASPEAPAAGPRCAVLVSRTWNVGPVGTAGAVGCANSGGSASSWLLLSRNSSKSLSSKP